MEARDIAQRLRELRGNRSRLEVANAIGVSLSAYRMYENAERIPRDPIKAALANYYGVSVGYLFFGMR